MMNYVLGIVFVLGFLATLVVMLSHGLKRDLLGQEAARKTLHIGMGLLATAFPWMFSAFWPIAVLAVLATVGLMVLRTPRLRGSFGLVLGSAERSGLGIICFSAGIACAYALFLHDAERRVVLYVVPVLTMAIADAVAALVGERYGRHRFNAVGGRKSIEGSMAFFVIASCCCLLPLLCMPELSLSRALVLTMILATTLTLVEASAGFGLDNLLLPVIGQLVLSQLYG
jgi:phytol kinase